jgi:glutathione S-transferase
MKLYYAQTSPYVRKALVVANEVGIEGQLEKVDCSTTTPVNPDQSNANPLKKIPALELDDGMILFDSPVICEYLDTALGNGSLFPNDLPARWIALRFQALGDGLLDAAILLRYETVLRPENLCWDKGVTAQMNKIDDALADMENHAASFGERIDIGTISVACAVGYLDFRFKDKDWRTDCPTLAAWYEGFAKRPSMQATRPPDL